MMSNLRQRRLKVDINGQSYTFVGKASLINMKTSARLLKQQLAQIERLLPSVSEHDASILLAYNAISNQLKLRYRLDRLTKDKR